MNNTCYEEHWKEHKAEHNRLVKLLPSTGETKEEPTEDNKKTTDENKSKTTRNKKLMFVFIEEEVQEVMCNVGLRRDKNAALITEGNNIHLFYLYQQNKRNL